MAAVDESSGNHGRAELAQIQEWFQKFLENEEKYMKSHQVQICFYLYLVVINIISMFVMISDKRRAVNGVFTLNFGDIRHKMTI